MDGQTLDKIVVIGILILLGLVIFNTFSTYTMQTGLDGKIEEAKELAKPVVLELVHITAPCTTCFDMTQTIDIIKAGNFEISEQTLGSDSPQAKALISQYTIKKLPALIIRGEIDKTNIQSVRRVDDALLFDGVVPPYVDASGEIIGAVSAIILKDDDCDVCFDFTTVPDNLRKNGVFFESERVVSYQDSPGLIAQYGISRIPAILFSKDIDAYSELARSIQQSSRLSKDQYVVESRAPFVNVSTGAVRGLIQLTQISDASCSECYDVTMHKPLLTRMGLSIVDDVLVDVSSPEGQQLVERYALQKIPTVVLTGDLEAYETFETVWEKAGTVEDDGTYVFRKMEALGPEVVFRDLTTGDTVRSSAPLTS